MMNKFLVALVALSPSLAYAHPGHGELAGFTDGLLHPVLGLDHLFAALAVGIWAAGSPRRRALAIFPAAFLFGVLIGGAQGISGLTFPYYDAGILVSLAVLGLGLFAAVRPTLAQSCAILAIFGWLHGNAHGAELSSGSGAAMIAAGFLLATAVLHAAGISSVLWIEGKTNPRALSVFSRCAGVVCLVATGYLWLS